jgi:nitrogen regulatory protein P-II 1
VKLITAVLPVSGFESVQQALRTLGIPGMTVCPVFADSSTPRYELYRGVLHQVDLQPAVRVDVLAADEDAADVVRVISVAGRGAATEGVAGRRLRAAIWVVPVDQVVRVRTSERGEAAI